MRPLLMQQLQAETGEGLLDSDWLLEYSPDSLIGAECEMRPLLVQHLQAVTGEVHLHSDWLLEYSPDLLLVQNVRCDHCW
jgi:hypothetical protein